MARTAREKSDSGIYHIMLRGIDKQLILEDDEDNQRLKEILYQCKEISGYKLYAYCFLGNHIHLLLKTEKESLAQIFKRIGARYVYYFNQKYKRSGHLFQDRFKSEPIDDDSYFLTVLRYIHNNPVKAGLSKIAAGYQWSSYNEYIKLNNLVDVEFVFGIINRDEFVRLHNELDLDSVLDVREDNFRITDSEALIIVKEVCGIDRRSDILGLDIAKRNLFIKTLRGKGLSIRQISRVTGVSKGTIERIK